MNTMFLIGKLKGFTSSFLFPNLYFLLLANGPTILRHLTLEGNFKEFSESLVETICKILILIILLL